MEQCKICGTNLAADLFSAVTQEPVCSICKIKYIGGLPTTENRVLAARQQLSLADGQYLQQNRGREAARILGRN